MSANENLLPLVKNFQMLHKFVGDYLPLLLCLAPLGCQTYIKIQSGTYIIPTEQLEWCAKWMAVLEQKLKAVLADEGTLEFHETIMEWSMGQEQIALYYNFG